ncbi:MAG: MFS transporter [Gammaproteobacteria bacterium]
MPISALLLGAAILFTGHGLQNVLIPVRASLEHFATSAIGAIASAYSVGFVGGCYAIPHMVKRVGHIRAFAVLAASAASVAFAMALLVNPWLWVVLRATAGFCLAGLFMVIESWLNEKSNNANRGQIFSLYMIVNLCSVMTGQLLLASHNPADFVLFSIAGIAIAMALVPVNLTSTAAPTPIRQVRLRLGRLYRMSPVGIVGCFFIGVANGAFGGLGPVYAQRLGLSVGGVALFMSAGVVGGAIAQFPIGKLSDRTDRRLVIIGVCVAAAAIELGLAATGGLASLATVRPLPPSTIIAVVGLLGCTIYTMYALCVAHTNDFIATQDFVEASSGLLMTYGLGAICGPLLAAYLMQHLGPGGLFVFTAAIHVLFALFTIYRIRRRKPVPPAARPEFVQTETTQITPASVILDPRAADSPPST